MSHLIATITIVIGIVVVAMLVILAVSATWIKMSSMTYRCRKPEDEKDQIGASG